MYVEKVGLGEVFGVVFPLSAFRSLRSEAQHNVSGIRGQAILFNATTPLVK